MFFGFFVFFGLGAQDTLANNIAVSNVSLQNQSVANATVEVKFNLTWDNSFSGTDANGASFYDRAWVFVKYWVVGTDTENTGWHHATLTSGGTLTPTSLGEGTIANIDTNQTVKWCYGTNGVAATATVRVRLCAIEVVYIPEGSFYFATIESERTASGGSRYPLPDPPYPATGDILVDSTTAYIPSDAYEGWPNGYSAFYIAKYELSQGQYSDFLNMLTSTEASNRFGSYTDYEHTITYTSGNSYGSRYAASAPNRTSARISWDDAKVYASWCAMRPMTEMEFEKAARGGGTTAYTYPWGNTDPSTGNSVYTPSGHISLYDAWQYYANHYDSANNITGEDGPTDVGLYLSGDIARTNEQTGASPYGVTDMAGNVWEHLINCAHTTTPASGDGSITPPASWPDADAGKGRRGGSWYHSSSSLRVSARDYAGWTLSHRSSAVGCRPARTP